MARSASVEPPKSGKRKGTRSVSTLTPTQLARKRANDREAQRAIRARTKEHIERLEKELEELKSKRNRDQTLQNLLRRNHALEEELFRLRETLGIPNPHYPPTSVYDDGLNGVGTTAAVVSPRSSPFGSQPDFGTLPLGSAYLPISDAGDQWHHALPPHSVASTVSSPSSTGNGDEFSGPTYIPTSIPTSAMMENSAMTTSTIPGLSPRIKREYDDLENDAMFPMPNPSISQQFIPQQQNQPQQMHQPHHQGQQQPQQSQPQPQAQQQWDMYPLYYPSSSVH